MSDPVADKSGFLRMYMSNHPDTLVAYARWHGQVKDALISAEMTAIDSEVCILTYLAHEPIPALANRLYISQSMTLTCKLKDGSSKVVRIVLDPPLLGYEEVKPRLLAMKVDAQEGLGMVWLDIVFREIKYLINQPPLPDSHPTNFNISFTSNYSGECSISVRTVLSHVLPKGELIYTLPPSPSHVEGNRWRPHYKGVVDIARHSTWNRKYLHIHSVQEASHGIPYRCKFSTRFVPCH